MANSNSINLAINTIQEINSIKQSLRGAAQSGASRLSKLDALINNQEKKTVLVDGLEGLSMDSADLKTEKDSLKTVCENILSNVPELTS